MGELSEDQALAREIASDLMKGYFVADVATTGYSWVSTYAAGSDVLIYRRFRGPVPEHAGHCRAQLVPKRVVAFCEENSSDVAVLDVPVRLPRRGNHESP